jgi:hypothetical protein
MERLPGDHRRVGDTDGIKEEDPWKFMTHLYIGDVVLAPATEAVEPGVMPSVARARVLHGERWPIVPAKSGSSLLPVTLSLRHAPKSATIVPLQTGIPFAMGELTDPMHIQLTDGAGVVIPIAARWTPGPMAACALQL